jgi:uncharacterized protein YndB with AHSA1/START domain
MTDTKPTGAVADKAIYRTIINAPIETVWNTLVKTDEILPFFFGSICEAKDGLKPGRRMRMITPDRKFAAVVGEVLEFSPPHRYSHTMAFTQYEGEAPSTVTYELREVPGGTEFSLTTTNVPLGSRSQKSMAAGGDFIVQNLKNLVETGKPGFSGAMVMMLNPLMGLMTPKISRIENWPLT